MLRVHMFTTCAPPFVCGGGRQALTLAKELAKQGISVTILTINIDKQAPQQEIYPNLKIKRVSLSRWPLVQTLLFGLWSGWYLWRQQHQIDVVHHIGAFLNSIPSLLFAHFLGKPIVVKLTNVGIDDPYTIQQRRFGKLFLRVLKLADQIVLTTNEFNQRYTQANLDPLKATRIVNGVDINAFKPLSPKPTYIKQQLQITPENPLILFVGNIEIRKGLDLLCHAWPEVRKKYPKAHLLLVGEVPDNQRLGGQLLIDKLSQLKNVHLHPYQQEITPYYQNADLFVLPSRSEGLPNATLEAMAAGLPVVLSDIGGHREIANRQPDVQFFPNEDVEGLIQAILNQLERLNKYQYATQSRAIILKRFSLKGVASQYIALYERLIK